MPQVDHLEKNMPLSSYNVNQQLTVQFQQFLSKPLPFSFFKSHITSREPLNDIHQIIVSELRNLEQTDKEAAKADLERKALENQRKEDDNEERRDDDNSLRQDRDKTLLITQQVQLSITREQLRNQLIFLERQIAIRQAQEAKTNQHGHPSTQVPQTSNEHSHPSESASQTHSHPIQATDQTHNHTHASETNEHSHPSTQVPKQPDPNLAQVIRTRHQLTSIDLSLRNISRDLIDIEQQARQRLDRKIERKFRLNAHLNLAQNKCVATIKIAFFQKQN